MAATAAMVVISAGSAVYQNQVRQKAKGDAAKILREQPDPTLGAPNAMADQSRAGSSAYQAAAAQRRRTLGASGRSDTIVTGPRGVTDVAPTARRTLLGL